MVEVERAEGVYFIVWFVKLEVFLVDGDEGCADACRLFVQQ